MSDQFEQVTPQEAQPSPLPDVAIPPVNIAHEPTPQGEPSAQPSTQKPAEPPTRRVLSSEEVRKAFIQKITGEAPPEGEGSPPADGAPPSEPPPSQEPVDETAQPPAAPRLEPGEPEHPIDVATKFLKSPDPKLRALGREIIAKLDAPDEPEPQEQVVAPAPDWNERLAQIRQEVENEKKSKYAYVEREYDENNPEQYKYVTKYDPVVDTPYFKEIVETEALRRADKEQFEWERRSEQEKFQKFEQQRREQEETFRRQMHEGKVKSVALSGYKLPDGSNTQDYFKGPDGKMDPARVEAWEDMVYTNLIRNADAVVAEINRTVPPHILNGPQGPEYASAVAIRMVWPKFTALVGKPANSNSLTTEPKPATANTQESRQAVPNNLLGKSTPPPARIESTGQQPLNPKSLASFVQRAATQQ